MPRAGGASCRPRRFPSPRRTRPTARFLGVAVDITELKRIQEELGQARDELELRVLERTAQLQHANEGTGGGEGRRGSRQPRQERLLANMSHEIRTPMNAILGHDGTVVGHASDGGNSATSCTRSWSRAKPSCPCSTTSWISPRSRLASCCWKPPPSICRKLVGDTMKVAGRPRAWQGPGTGLPRVSRCPLRGRGRPRPTAPDPDQPGGQRHQVHRAGRGRPGSGPRVPGGSGMRSCISRCGTRTGDSSRQAIP